MDFGEPKRTSCRWRSKLGRWGGSAEAGASRWLRPLIPMSNRPEPPARLRILNPFDPLLRDRARAHSALRVSATASEVFRS